MNISVRNNNISCDRYFDDTMPGKCVLINAC